MYIKLEDKDISAFVHIIQDTLTSPVTLQGCKFWRTKEMHGVVGDKLDEDEVC